MAHSVMMLFKRNWDTWKPGEISAVSADTEVECMFWMLFYLIWQKEEFHFSCSNKSTTILLKFLYIPSSQSQTLIYWIQLFSCFLILPKVSCLVPHLKSNALWNRDCIQLPTCCCDSQKKFCYLNVNKHSSDCSFTRPDLIITLSNNISIFIFFIYFFSFKWQDRYICHAYVLNYINCNFSVNIFTW